MFVEHGLPMYFWSWGSWLIPLLAFITGIAATFLYYKWKKPVHNWEKEDSLMILKNRFANGEISQEDFEKMKRVLLS